MQPNFPSPQNPPFGPGSSPHADAPTHQQAGESSAFRTPGMARNAQQLHDAIDALAERIAHLDASEHGFSSFDAAHAHDQVQRVNWQDPTQDLAGWMIPAKDLVDVTGMPTTFGNITRSRIATETHPTVAAYMKRGAIVPGKTATCEFGMTAYTEPVGMPAPLNPLFDTPHTPGGSSGGAAVMVARGLLPAAQASDGGGSIRIPAAATGLVGLKPAHDTKGGNCIASGFLTGDFATLLHLYRIRPQLLRLRIGVLLTGLHAPLPQNLDEECLEVVEQAATRLSALGHEVVSLPKPYGPEVFQAFQDAMSWRAAKIPGEASVMVSWLRDCGRRLSTDAYHQALQVLGTVRSRLLHTWDVDVVLTPMLTFAPPPIGYFENLSPEENFYHQTQWTPWGAMYNMAGCPALSLPWEQHRARLQAGTYAPSIQLGGLRVPAEVLCGLALQLAADTACTVEQAQQAHKAQQAGM